LNPRPHNPRVELEGALDRGNLQHAITLAQEVSEGWRRPLALGLGLRFLPLVALRHPATFDRWALRWLVRWITETRGITVERVAEVACCLADARTEPLALESVTRELRQRGETGRSASH
jgi:hypothetical protein